MSGGTIQSVELAIWETISSYRRFVNQLQQLGINRIRLQTARRIMQEERIEQRPKRIPQVPHQ
jgi:hypothetical protein